MTEPEHPQLGPEHIKALADLREVLRSSGVPANTPEGRKVGLHVEALEHALRLMEAENEGRLEVVESWAIGKRIAKAVQEDR